MWVKEIFCDITVLISFQICPTYRTCITTSRLFGYRYAVFFIPNKLFLSEPIQKDYRTAVCPFIDVIDFETFEYRAQDEGRRGGFDWEFFYKRLPLLPEDEALMPEPFK